MERAGEMHTRIEKPSRLSAGGTGLRSGPTAVCLRGQSTLSRPDCGVPRPCLYAQTKAGSVSGSHGPTGPPHRARGRVHVSPG
jgi:hypothetical protein